YTTSCCSENKANILILILRPRTRLPAGRNVCWNENHRQEPAHVGSVIRIRKAGYMARSNSHFASLTFKVAAEIWYEDQKPYWRKSTADSYEKYIRRLSTYFNDLKLEEIRIEHLREYQKINNALTEDGLPRFVASSINHDLNTLAQILAQAGVWEAIRPFYKP